MTLFFKKIWHPKAKIKAPKIQEERYLKQNYGEIFTGKNKITTEKSIKMFEDYNQKLNLIDVETCRKLCVLPCKQTTFSLVQEIFYLLKNLAFDYVNDLKAFFVFYFIVLFLYLLFPSFCFLYVCSIVVFWIIVLFCFCLDYLTKFSAF